MQRAEKWTETYLRLLKAGQQHDLEPQELEVLALAAYLTGRDAESFRVLERAHKDYLNDEKTKKAARCAFWLGFMLMNSGERARSSGWMARGERLLTDRPLPDCAEKGLFLIPAGLGALAAGHVEQAMETFERAAAMGEQFCDANLTALGRLGQGQALIRQGDVARGIKLLDEAMVILEAEDVSPVVNGVVYCAVIETCRKVWDLRRAQEWTAALTRWCDEQPDIVPFRGQCLVRRAEIVQFHGDWRKALGETEDACTLLTRPPGGPAAGEAFYRKGELHRLLGDVQEAENCYQEAAKWGRKPQPGLALLRLAQKQPGTAETSIRNTLKEAKDPVKRAELLPAVVHIMITAKKHDEAVQASQELDDIARRFDVPYLHAASFYCRGAVLLDEANVQPALEHLQTALTWWNTLQVPYESALARELKGVAYRKLNDKDNSDAELSAARWIFEQLGAKPDRERVDQLLNGSRHRETLGLTLRELQVLRRVASGKTNKSVAGELFISERTVDRHMSNIFIKLDVSSRVEATTFALKNKILDREL